MCAAFARKWKADGAVADASSPERDTGYESVNWGFSRNCFEVRWLGGCLEPDEVEGDLAHSGQGFALPRLPNLIRENAIFC